MALLSEIKFRTKQTSLTCENPARSFFCFTKLLKMTFAEIIECTIVRMKIKIKLK